MQFNGVSRRSVVVGGLSSFLLAGGLAAVRPAFAQDTDDDAAASPVALAATPSADASEFTIVHAQGETTVPANPEKVVVFDLGIADTLATLGITVTGIPQGGQLVGFMEQFTSDDYENVGTLFEPDYEMVASIDPDLIIVANRSAAVYPELAKIGPTIDLTGQTGDVIGDLNVTVGIIATIFGKEAEAGAALTAIDERIVELKANVDTTQTALIIMTSGGSVTAIAPGGNRGGLIYNTLGMKTPVEDIEAATHGEAISFEFLLEHNADWLFVIDRDAAIGTEDAQAAEEVLDNDIVHETTAWQNNQIIYLQSYDWYVLGSGLTTVNAMIDQLAPLAGMA